MPYFATGNLIKTGKLGDIVHIFPNIFKFIESFFEREATSYNTGRNLGSSKALFSLNTTQDCLLDYV